MIVCVCIVFSFIGNFYIGIVCIVVFNWLFVCYIGGIFILWVEDMDLECFKVEYMENI